MNEADYLLTLSEVSATFAGLAAIITVLRGPRNRQWGPRERVGLWGLLGPSLASFVFSLAPYPFLRAGLAPEALWVGVSAVLALGWIAGGLAAVRVLRRVAADGFPDPTPFSNPSLIALGIAAIGFAGGNALGAFGPASAAPYALALLASLGFSVVIFLTFLYASTVRERPQPEPTPVPGESRDDRPHRSLLEDWMPQI